MRAFNRFHKQLTSGAGVPARRPIVALAFGTGLFFAVLKSSVAVFTGSASMIAEAVHSWVGLVTDGFRVMAYLVAQRPPDQTHPLGYGRESYVWSLFGSIATFVAGSEFGVWRGLRQLHASAPAFGYSYAYLILAGSFAVQMVSFVQALRFVRAHAVQSGLGVLGHLLSTSDAQLRAAITEDFLAMIGVAVAAVAMALHQVTGNALFDAAGSILIGALMGIGGLFLIDMNRRFLAGVPLQPELRERILQLMLQAPEIHRVTSFFAEFIGPEKLLISARVELAGDHDQAELARILRRLEARIMMNRRVGRATLTLSAPEEPDLT